MDCVGQGTAAEPSGGSARVLVVGNGRRGARPRPPDLEGLECEVFQAASGAAALNAVRREPFDLALCDLQAGGLELLPRLLAEQPGLDVVIVTASPSLTTAVEAMRLGARDYLPAPIAAARIRHLLDDKERSRREQRPPFAALQERPPAPLEAVSPRMQAVLRQVKDAAATGVPVLLTGERGSGKGVLARAIHARGPRRERPFVVVSCDGLSEEELSHEVFGWARDTFTDAARDERGRAEAAHGGTLFLEGLGEASPALGTRLLRLVRQAQLVRLGETSTRTADVRLVASSRRGAWQRGAGPFGASDEAIEIAVPPLRDRVGDILPLARTFAAAAARRARMPIPRFSPAVEQLLVGSPWPGNVRELRDVIDRALLSAPGETLLPDAFPGLQPAPPTGPPRLGGDFSAEEIEKEHVLRVLARSETLREASRILGMDRNALARRRKKWGR